MRGEGGRRESERDGRRGRAHLDDCSSLSTGSSCDEDGFGIRRHGEDEEDVVQMNRSSTRILTKEEGDVDLGREGVRASRLTLQS